VKDHIRADERARRCSSVGWAAVTLMKRQPFGFRKTGVR
jgi:hypothetical protein